LSKEEIQETMAAFQKELMEKYKEKGEAFLAENKKKEGVKTLPDGLQYKVIKAGTGKKPKADDVVTVNYRGTLIDGTEFDSSYKRGQPATLPVSGGMIPGWAEALQLMEEGAKWEIFIPSNLAYGESGRGGIIGPNATLIFEVELVSIKEKPQANKPEKK
jgi:FKBP-type peptidyl-prolyl cis-trans isomerase FklB